MKCNHCGTKLRNESNFCFGCGKSVNAKDCYIAELKESGKVLTRQTDKDSLNRIIELTEKIFNRTRENPDLKYETRRFVENYLPMVTDVVSRYKNVKGHKAVKDQVDEIKDNLTEVLDRTEEASVRAVRLSSRNKLRLFSLALYGDYASDDIYLKPVEMYRSYYKEVQIWPEAMPPRCGR